MRTSDKTAAEKKKKGYRDVANPDGNNGNAFNHVVDNQNDDDEDDDHTPAERLEAGEKVLVQGSSKVTKLHEMLLSSIDRIFF